MPLSFRQSVPKDFSSDNHETQNRLLYPEMTAQLRSERSKTSRQIRVKADVSGFILDVDSTIPDHFSSLIDVYRKGKQRMERLGGAGSSRNPATPNPALINPTRHDKSQRRTSLASNILVSLTFASGQVHLHSKANVQPARRSRTMSIMARDPTDDSICFDTSEFFHLPVVSVWGEYRSSVTSVKNDDGLQPEEPSALFFKSTVHSSQNTLRPTLLPFLSEIVKRMEDHMRRSSYRAAPSVPPSVHEYLPSITTEAASTTEPSNSMRITLSLRIDQSKLEFTCQPDANVVAGLHWDSGGFIINIAPGARKIAFTGTVGGLTVGLKHGFLSEDCVKLDARNLAFSMAFTRALPGEAMDSRISVVLDTKFSGAIRFSRLQDVLCFKAVWLDRIPVFRPQVSTPASEVPRTPGKTPSSTVPGLRQGLTTGIIFRLRQINLDIDLGQSISSIKLELTDVLMRTKITETLYELGLSVSELSLLAAGNVSGRAYVPDFRFQTLRRNEKFSMNSPGDRMLDLTMTSGALNVNLESEYHRLLQYR